MTRHDCIDALLRTGRAPGPDEASVVVDAIAATELELALLENQVRAVQVALQAALARLGHTRTRLDTHKSLLAPVRRVPDEVLSEIFLHCLPMRHDPACLPTPSVHDAPVVLGRVCRSWRETACTTPRLWTDLALTYRKGALVWDGLSQDAKALTVWMSRSGSCPFTLHLDYEDRRFYDGLDGLRWENGVNHVVSVLQPHTGRLQCVRGILPASAFKLFCDLARRGSSQLETLDIVTSPSAHPSHAIALDISNAARLTNLKIAHTNIHILFHGSTLFNLRNLVILSHAWLTLSLEDCWLCLQHCPSLEVFGFPIASTEAFGVDTDSLEVPFMTNFQLSIYATVEAGPLFDSLRMPALRRLVVQMRHSLDRPMPQLASFIERSQPPLEMLCVTRVPTTENDLLSCLRYTPQLTTLSISGVPVTDATLSALTPGLVVPGGATSCMCPQLRDIAFSGCRSLSRDAMVNMIVSRWEGASAQDPRPSGRALRNVTIRQCGMTLWVPTLQADPALAKCVNGGLRLQDEVLDICD